MSVFDAIYFLPGFFKINSQSIIVRKDEEILFKCLDTSH